MSYVWSFEILKDFSNICFQMFPYYWKRKSGMGREKCRLFWFWSWLLRICAQLYNLWWMPSSVGFLIVLIKSTWISLREHSISAHAGMGGGGSSKCEQIRAWGRGRGLKSCVRTASAKGWLDYVFLIKMIGRFLRLLQVKLISNLKLSVQCSNLLRNGNGSRE